MATNQGPLGLLTDLYQLTMAAAYWRHQMAEREAVFHLTFRHCPFGGEYAIACGLADAVDFFRRFRFSEEDIAYLRSLRGADDKALFEAEFLDYLARLTFDCDVHAIPEGTVVFPHEPLVRVSGPLLQAQIVETALLTIINFQTLVATKATRICRAAEGDPVLEFGLRRAQGMNGGVTASRAAYVGGCAGTSNVLAGQRHGIPIRGTHAHSWVMAFESERDSFFAYADAMPNNCLLLVDTYDTLSGVDKAIEVGRQLQSRGQRLLGVRLDSGDLAALSIAAREKLDAAGFHDAVIVASNDLDEYEIAKLKRAGARINVWGVGTRLVTCFDQPALGGVYKLGQIRNEHGEWQDKMKLSEQPIKASNPGVQQVRRFYRKGAPVADIILDGRLAGPCESMQPLQGASYSPHGQDTFEELLRPVFRKGELVSDLPTIDESRQTVREQLEKMPPTIFSQDDPHPFPVGLETELHERKLGIIHTARRGD